ncbi:NUDIX hydrolase [Serinibacter salmoneus]|uniref:ADP-ribose pyrophosphatase YjhB (NUDIX family) n=1 Tax=Serinibacter salmoneus TaxID=556530 RepID=A0A2A9D2F0_9MICO|nr:NUDIX domain-containing protein [Serinibacter salmoneus]PFG20833.1 ADP-ribose pyrophosphatase YjhB (NUDIX family) [Serinibacter salmoneus]
MTTIRISACVITRPDGALLLVRKRGTERFMQPGGKQEPGESPAATAVREVAEELGLHLTQADLAAWGEFSEVAANEPGHRVEAHAFHAEVSAAVANRLRPRAELEEAVWVQPAEARSLPLAPLTEVHLLPLLTRISGTDA